MRKPLTRLFGAHLSIAGGYVKGVERAKAIGANCLQVFSGSPRSFARSRPPLADITLFREQAKADNVQPVYFHAPYLVNLASEEMTGDLSVKLLIAEFEIAASAGVRGSIIHLGSFKKAEGEVKKRQKTLLIERIREILKRTPPETFFIIENAASLKIGQHMEEIGEIIQRVGSERVRVCLDTCHLHAAGFDLTTEKKLDDFLLHVDRTIGLKRLELIHANDSRDLFGSFCDRHENIGEGKVGTAVFSLLLNHPSTSGLPFIIETPGFDQMGPDQKNLDILKGLVH